MLERVRPGIAGGVLIAAKEMAGEIESAQPFDVHGERGHVQQGVDMAEGVVEFEAIQ